MKDLSVSEFKAHLAATLREVRGGETVVITEHRKPVAEVRSIDLEGRVFESASRPFKLDDSRPSAPATGLAAELLDEDRGRI